jgi:hypothetical protein
MLEFHKLILSYLRLGRSWCTGMKLPGKEGDPTMGAAPVPVTVFNGAALEPSAETCSPSLEQEGSTSPVLLGIPCASDTANSWEWPEFRGAPEHSQSRHDAKIHLVTSKKETGLNVAAKWEALLLRIREIVGSKLGSDTGYPDSFVFP